MNTEAETMERTMAGRTMSPPWLWVVLIGAGMGVLHHYGAVLFPMTTLALPLPSLTGWTLVAVIVGFFARTRILALTMPVLIVLIAIGTSSAIQLLDNSSIPQSDALPLLQQDLVSTAIGMIAWCVAGGLGFVIRTGDRELASATAGGVAGYLSSWSTFAIATGVMFGNSYGLLDFGVELVIVIAAFVVMLRMRVATKSWLVFAISMLLIAIALIPTHFP